MAASKTIPAPKPGTLEQEITLDVIVRVTMHGKREVIERDVRDRFERELPLQFSGARVMSVRKATR